MSASQVETVRFERLERGWVRVHLGELTSGGYQLSVHVVGPHDHSANHARSGYDSACGWCYLGANHSDSEHARKLSEAHAAQLAGLLLADLSTKMPGCRISTRAIAGGWAAEAQHKVTGRRMTVRVVGRDWAVSTGPGSCTSGSSAYGFDSAVIHGYRHDLDFDSEHGPGTAWDYAQAAR